jgi:predicted TPR repeat methyltransferase
MSDWPEINPSRVLAGLYSSSAREYAELWAPVLQPTSERLIAAMPLAGATTVLDLGAGTGALFPALRAAAPKARVIAVDRATGMLREARARGVSAPLAAMELAQLGIRESVADANRAYCWGAGTSGQLGSGTTPNRQPTPLAVVGPM